MERSVEKGMLPLSSVADTRRQTKGGDQQSRHLDFRLHSLPQTWRLPRPCHRTSGRGWRTI